MKIVTLSNLFVFLSIFLLCSCGQEQVLAQGSHQNNGTKNNNKNDEDDMDDLDFVGTALNKDISTKEIIDYLKDLDPSLLKTILQKKDPTTQMNFLHAMLTRVLDDDLIELYNKCNRFLLEDDVNNEFNGKRPMDYLLSCSHQEKIQGLLIEWWYRKKARPYDMSALTQHEINVLLAAIYSDKSIIDTYALQDVFAITSLKPKIQKWYEENNRSIPIFFSRNNFL